MTATHDYELFPGIPSLKGCRTLKVKGQVLFTAHAIFQGEVTVENPTHSPLPVPPGIHRDTHVIL